MRNLFKSSTAASIGLLIGRLQVGAYFMLEGSKKLNDGLDVFVPTMAKHLPSFVPTDTGRALLYALPFIQIAAGAMMIFGLFTRAAAAIAAVVLLSIAGSKSMFTDPVDVMFHHTLAFLGVAILLSLNGGGEISVHGLIHAIKRLRVRRHTKRFNAPALATGVLAPAGTISTFEGESGFSSPMSAPPDAVDQPGILVDPGMGDELDQAPAV